MPLETKGVPHIMHEPRRVLCSATACQRCVWPWQRRPAALRHGGQRAVHGAGVHDTGGRGHKLRGVATAGRGAGGSAASGRSARRLAHRCPVARARQPTAGEKAVPGLGMELNRLYKGALWRPQEEACMQGCGRLVPSWPLWVGTRLGSAGDRALVAHPPPHHHTGTARTQLSRGWNLGEAHSGQHWQRHRQLHTQLVRQGHVRRGDLCSERPGAAWPG
jgi:hypothetical protein